MTRVEDTSAVATRFVVEADGDTYERDILVEVEAVSGDVALVDLLIEPRTEDVVTCSMTPSQAWTLVRALARAATEAERED